MTATDVQEMCEQGQSLLMETRYLEAERLLAAAEKIAWESRDWDALSRLYMPLQEARRQRRQRCGEGVVALDLISEGAADEVDPGQILANFPHGQLLVAGWGSIKPALGVRELADRQGHYVETFLAAVYPVGAGKAIVIVPTQDVVLPTAGHHATIDALLANLPTQSIVLNESELPRGSRKGNDKTYAEVMSMWERLASPFLAAAEQSKDPIARAFAFRQTIRVDYACELAHQHLSDLAREMERRQRESKKR
jgi:hypothetical protein